MSLVGPRPIVEGEIKYYKNVYRLYTQVSPGITGMWQISGRTDTSYTERVNFDEYYIRNWSVWLDIYILVRTAWIVVTKKGAY
jgi:lipopolysaccharide/colanic/teichoic acid biosynthesis glycosyltransferase